MAEAMDALEIVSASDGSLGTNGLKTALKERGFGSSTIDPALAELRAEDPPRVRQAVGRVIGTDGKQRSGRPWTTYKQPNPTEPNRTRGPVEATGPAEPEPSI